MSTTTLKKRTARSISTISSLKRCRTRKSLKLITSPPPPNPKRNDQFYLLLKRMELYNHNQSLLYRLQNLINVGVLHLLHGPQVVNALSHPSIHPHYLLYLRQLLLNLHVFLGLLQESLICLP